MIKILMDEEGHICLFDFEMSERLEVGQLTKSDQRNLEYLGTKNRVLMKIMASSSRSNKEGRVWALY